MVDRGKPGPFEKLEAATGTLEKERLFFNALLEERSVATVVNRIIYLAAFLARGAPAIVSYLDRRAAHLWPETPLEVVSALVPALVEIVRSTRLAAYLCVKGLPSEALTVLRGTLEQICVYTHIWNEPHKHAALWDPDSRSYEKAFRYPRDRQLRAELKEKEIAYRFLHCSAARELSAFWSQISQYYVHRRVPRAPKSAELSCEFVDRAHPAMLSIEYQMVQALLATIYLEMLTCIPQEDQLADEIAGFTIASAIFGPTMSAVPGQEDPTLQMLVSDLIRLIAEATKTREPELLH